MTIENYVQERTDLLKHHPLNPRRGDIEAIRASIREHGFYGALVGQTSTTYILVGNHRLEAAKAEGMTHVPVIWLDVSDEEAQRIMLADNRTADKGGYHDEVLLDLLEQLEGLEGTGYTGDDLDDLLAQLEGALILPEQEFKGGYAESDDERDARRGQGGQTRRADGLTDVVLVFTLADFRRFAQGLKTIEQRTERYNTTGGWVIEALRECTK